MLTLGFCGVVGHVIYEMRQGHTAERFQGRLRQTMEYFLDTATFFTLSLACACFVVTYDMSNLYDITLAGTVVSFAATALSVIYLLVQILESSGAPDDPDLPRRKLRLIVLGTALAISWMSILLVWTQRFFNPPDSFAQYRSFDEQCFAALNNLRGTRAVVIFTLCWLAIFILIQFYVLFLGFKHNIVPTRFQKKVPFLGILIALVLLGATWIILLHFIQRSRTVFTRLVGSINEQDKWSIEQLLALFIWLPTLIEWLPIIPEWLPTIFKFIKARFCKCYDLLHWFKDD